MMNLMRNHLLGAMCLAVSSGVATAADNLVMFSVNPNDGLQITFAPGDAGPGPRAKVNIEAYVSKVRPLLGRNGTQLLVLPSYPNVAGEAGRAKAIERAGAVRQQLASRLAIEPERIAIIPVARVGSNAAELRVELVSSSTAARSAADDGARLGWLPGINRFIIVCPDGLLPSYTAEWPDDFMIDKACGVKAAKVASGRVGWNEASGKWQILCPDGRPVPTDAGDPDDVIGLKRCAKSQ